MKQVGSRSRSRPWSRPRSRPRSHGHGRGFGLSLGLRLSVYSGSVFSPLVEGGSALMYRARAIVKVAGLGKEHIMDTGNVT